MDHRTLLLLLTVSGITASMGKNAVTKVVVKEGSDALLPCSLGNHDSLVQKVFDWKKYSQTGSQEVFVYARGDYYDKGMTGQDWQFRRRVFHFPDELKNGNASITIRNTIVADSGNYTCIFPDFWPYRKVYVWLTVHYILKDRSAENIPGTVVKPQIWILNATEDGVQLLCEVSDVFPEPSLEWQDSEGNVCPAGEPLVSKKDKRFSVSLIGTVTRTSTNRFQCVSTQQEVHHRTASKVDVPGKMFEECEPPVQVGFPAGTFVLGVFVGLFPTVVVVVLFIRRRKRDQRHGAATSNNSRTKPVESNGYTAGMTEEQQPNNHVIGMTE